MATKGTSRKRATKKRTGEAKAISPAQVIRKPPKGGKGKKGK